MSPATLDTPRVLRALPGRLRVHLEGWDGEGAPALEQALRDIDGVLAASLRASTGNALIEFDARRTDAASVLDAAAAAISGPARRRRPARKASRPPHPEGDPEPTGNPGPQGGDPEPDPDQVLAEPAGEPAAASWRGLPGQAPRAARAAVGRVSGVLREGAGHFGRARIAVRGIDRDPQLARRVVETLERRPDVRRAVASATTGRVLVEFSQRVASLQDVVA